MTYFPGIDKFPVNALYLRSTKEEGSSASKIEGEDYWKWKCQRDFIFVFNFTILDPLLTESSVFGFPVVFDRFQLNYRL